MSFFPKTSKVDKSPYTFHCIHSDNERPWNYECLQWVGIDPGNRNLGIRVEKRYRDGRVQMVAMGKYQLSRDETRDGIVCRSASLSLLNLLQSYREYFLQSHVVVIERQVPENLKATRVAQHMVMYFTQLLSNTALRPLLVEVDPKMKFRELGAPKGINKAQQKIWISDFMHDLYEYRGEIESLRYMGMAAGKRDEMAEPGAIIESFSMYLGFGTSIGVREMMEKHKYWTPASSRISQNYVSSKPRPHLLVQGETPNLTLHIE